MTASPLISVILPCYNAAAYLQEALDSVIGQTYRNLEIIVINDGSTDATHAILSAYIARDHRICYLENGKNLGLIETLNRGVSVANGAYIARMDADDRAALNRLEVQVNYLEKNAAIALVASGNVVMDEEGNTLVRQQVKGYTQAGVHFASFFTQPLVHGSVVIRTEVLKSNLYQRTALHCEDYELWIRLLQKGYKMAVINLPLYYSRKNRKSVSHQYEQAQIKNFTALALAHIERYFPIVIPEKIGDIILNRISASVTHQQVTEAFQCIDQLRQKFLEYNPGLDRTSLNDIEKVTAEQKADILLQALKRSSTEQKRRLFILLLNNLSLLVHCGSYIYFKIKAKAKSFRF